jgi:signal transduction histidine kinase
VALRDRMLKLAKAPHLPRRTVRLRLTLLYGALFLVSGAALLTLTYFFVDEATGNAFIVQGKNGTTIAGYEIGNPNGLPPQSLPGAGPNGKQEVNGNQTHANSASGKSGTSALSGGGKSVKKSGGRASAEAVTGLGPGGSAGDSKAVERQMAEQTREFTALAYAYRDREREQLLTESGIALAIMAVVSVLLGWLMAGRVLRPLRTITATTRDISASNLHERLGVRGPDDELKELGDTIDGLLERLDAAFRSQRQFVANASHELRTPLARQRALAQVALSDPDATEDSLRAAHERILASGEQQEQMIDALLTLSRAQSATLSAHDVDLTSLVEDQLDEREVEAAARQVTIVPALGPAELRADPRLLERLVENLLDNALRHNVPGGRVSAQTGTRDDGAWLAVSNDGPVIRPGDVARLYEPFQRLDPERTTGGEGFGLGLCIVRAVAAAHGATLETVARPAGGLRVEVRFPSPDGSGAEDGSSGTGRRAPGLGSAPAAGSGLVEVGGGPPGAGSDLVRASTSDR